MSTDLATSEQDEAAAAKEAVAQTNPLLLAFDAGGRSSLSRFTKADFDRALGAYLPSLMSAPDPALQEKVLALLETSPACALPYEFTLLFSVAERRRVCDQRATVCLDYYLERFSPSFRDLPTAVYIGDCALCCCERALIRERPCCRLPACAGCLGACVRLALSEGRPQVVCPGCPAGMRRGELSLLYLQGDPALTRRHEQLLADHRRDPNVKTCPACGHICHRHRSNADLAKSPDVVCEACGHPWCFACHGPRHPDRPCLDDSDPDRRLLTAWSRQMRSDGNDEDGAAAGGKTRTARACPKCGALIERNGGCRQVSCTVCRTDFCYMCGKKYKQDGRFLGLVPKRLLGDHESRFSVFGCSANFLPDQPRLRRAIRRGALALAIGGAAVGGLAASPLLLLASPVWAPLLAVREARRRRWKASLDKSYQDSASQDKSYQDSASQDKSYQDRS